MPLAVNTLVDHLNGDLANKYKQMLFYLHSSIRVQGIHREPMKTLFLAFASKRANHIQQIGDRLTGLLGTPSTKVNGFRGDLTAPRDILLYAETMELEALNNFVERKGQAHNCAAQVNGVVIELLMDDMISQSAADSDHLHQMLVGL